MGKHYCLGVKFGKNIKWLKLYDSNPNATFYKKMLNIIGFESEEIITRTINFRKTIGGLK